MVNWRRVNRAVHRDVGYFCAALTLVYAISGVAVNHTADWNPSYKIERVERTFAPIAVGSREEMVAALVTTLELPGPPQSSFRSAPHLVDLFYEGWSVKADATAGKATIERPRDRVILRDVNFLHLNHPKGVWTWVADGYAVLLALLAITGLFILRGRNGLTRRGIWFVGAGLLLPVGFLIVLRYV
ncbi:MAG: PepSY-associated TM helix domain-containing protein [Thermoanaerobaculia bacterium]